MTAAGSGDPEDATPRASTVQKRDRILDAAMRQFAEKGFDGMRVEDLAAELDIAKGSVFQHFGSKDKLFLAVYRRAVHALPSYLDAPAEVKAAGFWAVLEYWLRRTEHLLHEDRVPSRIVLLGNYGTSLDTRREINRLLVSEDPYGTTRFVELGLARGELRRDLDLEMIVSIVDWTTERFQDALLTEELDPRLFRRNGPRPERVEARIDQFLRILKSALGAPAAPA